jgi:hypothetical protein
LSSLVVAAVLVAGEPCGHYGREGVTQLADKKALRQLAQIFPPWQVVGESGHDPRTLPGLAAAATNSQCGVTASVLSNVTPRRFNVLDGKTLQPLTITLSCGVWAARGVVARITEE